MGMDLGNVGTTILIGTVVTVLGGLALHEVNRWGEMFAAWLIFAATHWFLLKSIRESLDDDIADPTTIQDSMEEEFLDWIRNPKLGLLSKIAIASGSFFAVLQMNCGHLKKQYYGYFRRRPIVTLLATICAISVLTGALIWALNIQPSSSYAPPSQLLLVGEDPARTSAHVMGGEPKPGRNLESNGARSELGSTVGNRLSKAGGNYPRDRHSTNTDIGIGTNTRYAYDPFSREIIEWDIGTEPLNDSLGISGIIEHFSGPEVFISYGREDQIGIDLSKPGAVGFQSTEPTVSVTFDTQSVAPTPNFERDLLVNTGTGNTVFDTPFKLESVSLIPVPHAKFTGELGGLGVPGLFQHALVFRELVGLCFGTLFVETREPSALRIAGIDLTIPIWLLVLLGLHLFCLSRIGAGKFGSVLRSERTLSLA